MDVLLIEGGPRIGKRYLYFNKDGSFDGTGQDFGDIDSADFEPLGAKEKSAA